VLIKTGLYFHNTNSKFWSKVKEIYIAFFNFFLSVEQQNPK